MVNIYNQNERPSSMSHSDLKSLEFDDPQQLWDEVHSDNISSENSDHIESSIFGENKL